MLDSCFYWCKHYTRAFRVFFFIWIQRSERKQNLSFCTWILYNYTTFNKSKQKKFKLTQHEKVLKLIVMTIQISWYRKTVEKDITILTLK